MKEQNLEQYSENFVVYKCFGNNFAVAGFTSKFYLPTCNTSVKSHSRNKNGRDEDDRFI